jgi:hypothetical protein
MGDFSALIRTVDLDEKAPIDKFFKDVYDNITLFRLKAMATPNGA